MLSVAEAESIVLGLAEPLNPVADSEPVALTAALGRVLAAPVSANLDFPHWDNSSMDGYAVRHAEVAAAREDEPVWLILSEEIPAGSAPQRAVESGQTARILTGSMLPAGADAVVMQEHTRRQGERVAILKAPHPQENVRQRGAFYQAGQPLLGAGTVLGAPELAALAAARCTPVLVYRRLRVAVFSTGDELVSLSDLPAEQPLPPGQIIDSNQLGLVSLVRQAGAEPLALGIVRDQPQRLRDTIAQAVASADLVLSSGGVSVGDYDYVDRILQELGAQLHIQAVAIRPGKPLTVARFSQPRPVLYFGLPGNPVSSLVSFWRFVQPALQKLSGQRGPWQPVFWQAVTTAELQSGGQRESYLWGQLRAEAGAWQFTPLGSGHNSGDLISLAGSNALAVLPVGQTRVAAHQPVLVMHLGPGWSGHSG